WGAAPAPPALFGDPNLPAGSPVEVLGQLFATYIAARVPEGLLLVDQHTAHEKIIFERITAASGRPPSQTLLLPQRVELSPSEALLVAAQIDVFTALGFDFEDFGGGSLLVRAVPA